MISKSVKILPALIKSEPVAGSTKFVKVTVPVPGAPNNEALELKLPLSETVTEPPPSFKSIGNGTGPEQTS